MKVFETEEYIDSLIDIVQKGHEVSLVVVGHSMEPFLVHERDSVLLSPINDPLQKGDIALFKREDGQYILHRIFAIRRDGFYFVGDNQNLCDIEGPVDGNQIFAVVHKAKRHGIEIQETGLLWTFFKKPWLWAIKWRRYLKKLLGFKHLNKIVSRKK